MVKKSEEEVDCIVRNIVANLAFEGLITPPEEIEELKEVVRGNIPREEYRRKILAECRALGEVSSKNGSK